MMSSMGSGDGPVLAHLAREDGVPWIEARLGVPGWEDEVNAQ